MKFALTLFSAKEELESCKRKRTGAELVKKIKENGEARAAVRNERREAIMAGVESEKATRDGILKNSSTLLDHVVKETEQMAPLRRSLEATLTSHAEMLNLQKENLRLKNEALRRKLE